MSKKNILDAMLKEILQEQKAKGPNFSGRDIPEGKNDIGVTLQVQNEEMLKQIAEQQPDAVTKQELGGDIALVVTLKDGRIQQGIMGALTTPVDALILIEALKKMQSEIAKRGTDFIELNFGK